MADKYISQEIEPKWQKLWAESGLYATREDPERPKFYFLTMLPYPSGDLHIGHWYAMTPSDAAARYRRMKGYNVFFPIGFDAFGLPAEGAAIKHGIHPYTWTMANIERMRAQLRSMGAMWAWDHEAVSCDPRYYAWTQWFFLKLYEHGLAYRKFAPVDFCPHCNTTLAREQVWGEDRHCERCGTPVIKKELEQWFFKITDYADELLRFDGIDWPERIRTMQTNWIGRSEGAEVTFPIDMGDSGSGIGVQSADTAIPNTQYPIPGTDAITVFTTRPDTLWGATFMVLAPEHPLVEKLTTEEHRAAVDAYRLQADRQTEIERTAADKEKTGVFIGAYAINPVNGRRIPIWIADYVMVTYGTGAIMAVPAHDERDFAFALKFGLPIIPVIERPDDLAKSAVWDGSVPGDFGAALSAAGFAWEWLAIPDRGRFYAVTLHGDEQVRAYVALLQAHLKAGHWADVVGRGWQVVFHDGPLALDSAAADAAIMARCHAGYDYTRQFATSMSMWWAVEWYRNVLYHADYGTMIHSEAFSGTAGAVAKAQVTRWLAEQGVGKFAVNYRLRDWLISRQRYWGAPIPIIYCPACGTVPAPYEDLPVLLPEDAEIPATGENALKFHAGFLNVRCPQCGGAAQRETDTMDTFMCSSWYHYAYVTPYWKAGQKLRPDDTPWEPEAGNYWLPVDQYTGGPEHATMHLLYTRFFTKALRDMGVAPFAEPMLRLFNQGIILGPDGNRMSKSKGNVVAPDEWVERYGADTVRAYLMFIGPWDAGGPWNSQGIEGVRRFLERVWNVVAEDEGQASGGRSQGPKIAAQVRELQHVTHKTLRKVTEDIEAFKFNTLLAALMEFNNYLVKARETAVYGTSAWEEALDMLLLMLAPETPHIAEELWQRRVQTRRVSENPSGLFQAADSIHVQPWPVWDPELAKAETVILVVQINGKVRDKIEAAADIGEAEARELALASPLIQRWLEGKTVRKVIFAGGKLLNFVVS
ncbi:MAG: leucine--tRNA ligase [Anaerolineae bacterium CG2_30_64_16]|nr:MAG: leucine--tRNA ligase [Anaerolineae bacterium CG2_30_64_16]